MTTEDFPCYGLERTTRFLCDAQLLTAMTDGMPGVVLYLDLDGHIRFANAVAERWVGQPKASLYGQTRFGTDESFWRACAELCECARRGERVEREQGAAFDGGAIADVRIHAYPDRDRSGAVQGNFLILLDITREKSFERALAAARDEAVAANHSKSRFLAAASHDLRQPLQAMTLFSRALTRRVQETPAAPIAADLEASLRSLRGMIDALLHLSKLESGLITPAPTTFRIAEVFEELSPGFAAMARERGLRYRHVATTAVLHADRALVETMLRNLVGNALKFTERGGIVVGVRQRAGETGIMVADSGIGIEETEQAQVFREFHRAKTTVAGPNDGIGLGLAIIDRLVKLHGGRIALRSAPGRGSCFTLWFPSNRRAVTAGGRAKRAIQLDGLHNLRLLVLDDDSVCADALGREFADNGADVTLAHSVAEADAAIATHGLPDGLVVDYNLGDGETGLSFIERLREARLRPRAVLLTGSTDPATLALLKSSGVPFLTKPADPTMLHMALRRALSA